MIRSTQIAFTIIIILCWHACQANLILEGGGSTYSMAQAGIARAALGEALDAYQNSEDGQHQQQHHSTVRGMME